MEHAPRSFSLFVFFLSSSCASCASNTDSLKWRRVSRWPISLSNASHRWSILERPPSFHRSQGKRELGSTAKTVFRRRSERADELIPDRVGRSVGRKTRRDGGASEHVNKGEVYGPHPFE